MPVGEQGFEEESVVYFLEQLVSKDHREALELITQPAHYTSVFKLFLRFRAKIASGTYAGFSYRVVRTVRHDQRNRRTLLTKLELSNLHIPPVRHILSGLCVFEFRDGRLISGLRPLMLGIGELGKEESYSRISESYPWFSNIARQLDRELEEPNAAVAPMASAEPPVATDSPTTPDSPRLELLPLPDPALYTSTGIETLRPPGPIPADNITSRESGRVLPFPVGREHFEEETVSYLIDIFLNSHNFTSPDLDEYAGGKETFESILLPNADRYASAMLERARLVPGARVGAYFAEPSSTLPRWLAYYAYLTRPGTTYAGWVYKVVKSAKSYLDGHATLVIAKVAARDWDNPGKFIIIPGLFIYFFAYGRIMGFLQSPYTCLDNWQPRVVDDENRELVENYFPYLRDIVPQLEKQASELTTLAPDWVPPARRGPTPAKKPRLVTPNAPARPAVRGDIQARARSVTKAARGRELVIVDAKFGDYFKACFEDSQAAAEIVMAIRQIYNISPNEKIVVREEIGGDPHILRPDSLVSEIRSVRLWWSTVPYGLDS